MNTADALLKLSGKSKTDTFFVFLKKMVDYFLTCWFVYLFLDSSISEFIFGYCHLFDSTSFILEITNLYYDLEAKGASQDRLLRIFTILELFVTLAPFEHHNCHSLVLLSNWIALVKPKFPNQVSKILQLWEGQRRLLVTFSFQYLPILSWMIIEKGNSEWSFHAEIGWHSCQKEVRQFSGFFGNECCISIDTYWIWIIQTISICRASDDRKSKLFGKNSRSYSSSDTWMSIFRLANILVCIFRSSTGSSMKFCLIETTNFVPKFFHTLLQLER